MSEAKLVEVASFLNKLDAEPALGALKNAGIDAMVAGDDARGEEPGLWMGGVKVLARAANAERALRVPFRAEFERPGEIVSGQAA